MLIIGFCVQTSYFQFKILKLIIEITVFCYMLGLDQRILKTLSPTVQVQFISVNSFMMALVIKLI